MLIILPFAAGAVVTYQAMRKSLATTSDDIADANSKIKQTILGAIVIESIGGVIAIVKTFYM